MSGPPGPAAGAWPALRQRGLAVVLALALVSGCGYSTTYPRSQVVMVKTRPEGARVYRVEGAHRIDFGRGPTPIHLPYEYTESWLNRWLFWSITGAMGAMAAGGTWWYLESDEEEGRGGPLLLAIVGGAGLVVGALLGAKTELGQRSGARPTSAIVGASYPGYQDGSLTVEVPLKYPELSLILSPAKRPGPGGTAAPATQPAAARPKVAVLEVRDERRKLGPSTLAELTALMAQALAGGGRYRVIPRAQLGVRLAQHNQGKGATCDTAACQRELRRALAADKSLDTRVLSVGSRCRVTAVLYDLSVETTDHAAAVYAPCTTEGLSAAMGELAERLSRKSP